jgi:hypothetical protein
MLVKVPPGDFSWCTDGPMLADAYQAVTAAEAWDFLRTETPPGEKGYMFWSHPTQKKIESHMKLLETHSGASYGWTMRQMEAIAKRGWHSWAANQMDPRSYSSG